MKKLGFILLTGLMVFSACEKDEIEKEEEQESNVNYDSRLRIESSNYLEGDFNAISTFAETKLDFSGEEVYEFSINMTDHIELTKSRFLLGLNMYSDNPIFELLEEGSSYSFDDTWIAGGPKDNFGVGLTVWDENHENGVIYSNVIGGEIVFSQIGNNRVRGLFNFEIVAPATNDTIKTKTSLVIAHPKQ